MVKDKRNLEIEVTAKDKASSTLKGIGLGSIAGAVGGAVGGAVSGAVVSAMEIGKGLIQEGFNLKSLQDVFTLQLETLTGKSREEVDGIIKTLNSEVFESGLVTDYKDLANIGTTVAKEWGDTLKTTEDWIDTVKFALTGEKIFGISKEDLTMGAAVGSATFMEEPQKALEIFNQTLIALKADAADLPGVIKGIESSADRLGYSWEELNERIIEFGNQGGTDWNVITKGLNSMISFLDSGATPEFDHFFRQILGQTRNLNKEWIEGSKEQKQAIVKDIGEVVEEISKLDAIKGNTIMEQIFGAGVIGKQGDAFLAFLGDVKDNIDITKNTTGEMVKQFEELDSVKLQGIINQFKQMIVDQILTQENMEAFRNFVLNEGPGIVDSIGSIVEALGNVAKVINGIGDSWSSMSGAFKQNRETASANREAGGMSKFKQNILDFTGIGLLYQAGQIGYDTFTGNSSAPNFQDMANKKRLQELTKGDLINGRPVTSGAGTTVNVNIQGNLIGDDKSYADLNKRIEQAVPKFNNK